MGLLSEIAGVPHPRHITGMLHSPVIGEMLHRTEFDSDAEPEQIAKLDRVRET